MKSTYTGLLGIVLVFGLVQTGRADVVSAVAGPWGFSLDSPPGDVGAYTIPSVSGVAYYRGHVTVLKSAGGGQTTLLPDGQYQIDSFFDVFTEVSLDGSSRFPLEGRALGRFTGPRGGTYTFDTEMLYFDLTGGGPLGGVMIRESPTRASQGITLTTDVGGGQYHIDSFFDIFTELSVDGGQNWTPQDNGAAFRVSGVGAAVPEPSTWVLLMTAAVGLGLSWRARRRSKA